MHPVEVVESRKDVLEKMEGMRTNGKDPEKGK